MPLIKKLLITMGIVALGVFLIGRFLPSKWSVKRSIVIQGAPEKVFPYINDLRKWEQWYPWNKSMDVSMIISYDGPEKGAGAIRKWSGSSVKTGVIEITRSVDNEGVWYRFTSDQTSIIVNGSLVIHKKGNASEVVWEDSGDSGYSILARFFAGGLDEVIGRSFEAGLQNLKKAVEESGAARK